MALDHYVSQVHLNKFCSPALGNRMFAIRKSDLFKFTPTSKAICRMDEGNTNAYLEEPRAVEEFLRDIEPKYSKAVERLRGKELNSDAAYVFAGFIAYVMACSPAGMRVNAVPIRGIVESTARLMDAKGLLPPMPQSLQWSGLTEMLDEGVVEIDVNKKYPQAIGVSRIVEHCALIGNMTWEVLLNPEQDCPFFTSDYPVALRTSGGNAPVKRVVPLAPDIAIEFQAHPATPRCPKDLSFSELRYRFRKIGRQEAIAINRCLVRCAEDLVIYQDNAAWVDTFIAKHRNYRIDVQDMAMPSPQGTMYMFWHGVVPYDRERAQADREVLSN